MKNFTLIITLLLLTFMPAVAQTSRSAVSADDYPFVITTNPESPVLYYIYTGRDGEGSAGGCVFENSIPYGLEDYKLQLMYPNPNYTPEQLWYFMEEDGKIVIISAADGRMVTVPNSADGAKKVYMKTEGEISNDLYTWTLDQTNGYYAFKTSDGKSFLSHNGNWQTGGPQMGLYNADGSKDEGSRVFFELYNNATSINGVKAEREFKHGIFTLTGKRIDKITRPGIYIVNGKKCVVR